jgi:hypothetical protein
MAKDLQVNHPARRTLYQYGIGWRHFGRVIFSTPGLVVGTVIGGSTWVALTPGGAAALNLTANLTEKALGLVFKLSAYDATGAALAIGASLIGAAVIIHHVFYDRLFANSLRKEAESTRLLPPRTLEHEP